jgi:hypothetical protein
VAQVRTNGIGGLLQIFASGRFVHELPYQLYQARHRGVLDNRPASVRQRNLA